MKKITMFYLTTCPYCKNAFKAIDALVAENAAYADIEIEKIEESEQPQIADEYDYMAVPSMFFGKEKQYEAHFGQSYEEIYENVKRVFDAAIADE